MNGRGFDYNAGRFLSVDPFIQDPGNSQSINGFAYIMNNPLSGTDPSGYEWEPDNQPCAATKLSDVCAGIPWFWGGSGPGNAGGRSSPQSNGVTTKQSEQVAQQNANDNRGTTDSLNGPGDIAKNQGVIDQTGCGEARVCGDRKALNEGPGRLIGPLRDANSPGTTPGWLLDADDYAGEVAFGLGFAALLLPYGDGTIGLTTKSGWKFYSNGWQGNQWIRWIVKIRAEKYAKPLPYIAIPLTVIAESDNIRNGNPDMQARGLVTLGALGLALVPSGQVPALGIGATSLLVPHLDSTIRTPGTKAREAAARVQDRGSWLRLPRDDQ